MSRVKNLTLFMVGLLFCYVMLIGGDFVLSRYKGTLNQLSNEDGRIIEKKRFQEEDVGNRLHARDAGYLPALYPSLIDDNATLRKIVIERGYGPLGGVPNAETYYCNEGYGLVTYRSDRFGLRNDDAKWDKDIDVIFIGGENENHDSGFVLETLNRNIQTYSLVGIWLLGLVPFRPYVRLGH